MEAKDNANPLTGLLSLSIKRSSKLFFQKKIIIQYNSVTKKRVSTGGSRHKLELARLAHPTWWYFFFKKKTKTLSLKLYSKKKNEIPIIFYKYSHICHVLLWAPDGADVARCSTPSCAFVAHCACVGATAKVESVAIAG